MREATREVRNKEGKGGREAGREEARETGRNASETRKAGREEGREGGRKAGREQQDLCDRRTDRPSVLFLFL